MRNYTYSSTLREEMTDFLKLRTSRGISSEEHYVLQRLDRYLVEQCVSEKTLTSGTIDGFIAHYHTGRTEKTIQRYVSLCSQFAKFLATLGIAAFIPDYVSATQSYIPYIFSEDEINRIFAAADNMKIHGLTERRMLRRMQIPMLLRLLYGCGLRLGEALYLRLENIDFDTGVLRILNAKGHKDRLVPMEKGLSMLLQRYCGIISPYKNGAELLFEGNGGTPLCQDYVGVRFRHILSDAGIDEPRTKGKRGVCLHCFRHTFAVHSFRMQDKAGLDNYSVSPSLSIYLGHYKLTGTQKYLHMTAENSEDIWNMTSEVSKSIIPGVPK